MVRISAIFIAGCMVLIAVSFGAVLFLRFGLSLTISALAAVGVLAVLAIYNVIAGPKQERAAVSDQVSGIARGPGDLARQQAEFDRRLGSMEGKIEAVLERALSAARPLANEIEELSRLVNQLAETVAQHDAALAQPRGGDESPMPHGSAQLPGARPSPRRSPPTLRHRRRLPDGKFRRSPVSTGTASLRPFAMASTRSASIFICNRS